MHQRESFKRNYKIGALKGNENITYQSLWDVAKVIFQGKFTVINTYISKGKGLNSTKCPPQENRTERHKINPEQAGERK